MVLCRRFTGLDRIAWGAVFLAGGDLECYLAHCRSVVVLCMLFKINSNPLHPLSSALHCPYVPARVSRGALIANRQSFGPPCSRTSQYRITFVLPSVSLSNELGDPVFDGMGLASFKSSVNVFLLS